MRPEKREKIDTLLLKQLSGSLSSAETAALQHFTDEYAEVKSLGRALQTRMETADAHLFKQSLDADQDWSLVLSRISEMKRRAYLRKIKIGLLITFLMLFVVYAYALFFSKMAIPGKRSKQAVPPTAIKPASLNATTPIR
jgi:hypothetical protein